MQTSQKSTFYVYELLRPNLLVGLVGGGLVSDTKSIHGHCAATKLRIGCQIKHDNRWETTQQRKISHLFFKTLRHARLYTQP